MHLNIRASLQLAFCLLRFAFLLYFPDALLLNALTGKKSFLITTNDYLAKRDCMEMKPLYEWLGLIKAQTPICSINDVMCI
jgi:hypothetical protein